MSKSLPKFLRTRDLNFAEDAGFLRLLEDNQDQYDYEQQGNEGLLDSDSDIQVESEEFTYEEKKQTQGDEEYDALEDLIFHLNEENHSEDEGISEYKIGGYHPCHVGEVLMNRYVLIQKLGWGNFSTVWLAKDFKYGNYVAVKIIKSSYQYFQGSLDEVEILQKAAQKAYDPEWLESLKKYEPNKTTFDRDDSHVLNLLNSFLYKGPYGQHFCMVFEILGVNLLKVLSRYEYQGLPLHLVKEITRQILMGLDYLNRICRVIHTDLKPENVLLCLTPEEIKKIVEDGQLSNKELYMDRLRLYRRKYHLGPETESENEEDEQETTEISLQIQMKIKQIEEKLNDENLNKNQRKNLRRKLKKYQEKGQQEVNDELTKQIVGQAKKEKKYKTPKQLFSAFDTKLIMDRGPKLQEGFKIKIADLGNACLQHHHFSSLIQTRNYRGPEVITGSKYNLSADIWSLACMTFEMLTGQMLFKPSQDDDENFGKSDCHLAQMMQYLGRFPKKFSLRGTKSRKYFTEEGTLIRFPRFQNWSIKDIMIAKHRFTEEQAQEFENFMLNMLQCAPEKRLMANELLKHPWLYKKSGKYLMDYETHEKIKKERYDIQTRREEVIQYDSEEEDASGEDNSLKTQDEQNDDEFFGYERVADHRQIDRSFTDLGYIGHGDGIFFEKLDAGPNWQFS